MESSLEASSTSSDHLLPETACHITGVEAWGASNPKESNKFAPKDMGLSLTCGDFNTTKNAQDAAFVVP